MLVMKVKTQPDRPATSWVPEWVDALAGWRRESSLLSTGDGRTSPAHGLARTPHSMEQVARPDTRVEEWRSRVRGAKFKGQAVGWTRAELLARIVVKARRDG